MKELVILLLSLIALQLFAQQEQTTPIIKQDRLSIELGLQKYFGYTQYQIGGHVVLADGTEGFVWSPLSQLKFPMEVFMLSMDLKWQASPKLRFNFNIKTNINKESDGKMEDSDWGIWYGTYPGANYSTLDVFSESTAKLKSWIIDGNFDYQLIKEPKIFRLSLGAGFLYQNFDYEVFDLTQWYPSYTQYSGFLPPQYGSKIDIAGKVLTYKVEYNIPYIQINPEIKLDESFELKASFKFSPFVTAKDFDNHILRSKSCKGEAKGTALMITLKALLKMTGHISLTSELGYAQIKTSGTQKQYNYISGNDVYTATIDNKIESEQYFISIGLGLSF